MTRRWCSPGTLLTVLGLLVLGSIPAPVEAQVPPDFMLRVPKASLSFRGGYAIAQGSSDIFSEVQEQLTMGRSDFDAPYFGAQLAFRIAPRFDIALDLAIAATSSKSEFRDWVDNNDLPIEQITDFRRVPVTLGFKAYLKDRGRSVGRFAWIPAKWAPYVGAAGGMVWYRFEQDGDFVDFETFDIFNDRFTSEGSAPTVHVYGGADWSLGPAFFLTAEGRYGWAKADMSGDFVGFDAMDLSGAQATIGISIRF